MTVETKCPQDLCELLAKAGMEIEKLHFDDTDIYTDGHVYDLYNCTQAQAMQWLRDVHNVDIWVRPQTGILGVKGYTPYITTYKLRTKGHMYYHEGEPDRYDSKDHFIPVPDDKGLIPAHQHYSKHGDAVEAALRYALTNLIGQ